MLWYKPKCLNNKIDYWRIESLYWMKCPGHSTNVRHFWQKTSIWLTICLAFNQSFNRFVLKTYWTICCSSFCCWIWFDAVFSKKNKSKSFAHHFLGNNVLIHQFLWTIFFHWYSQFLLENTVYSNSRFFIKNIFCYLWIAY